VSDHDGSSGAWTLLTGHGHVLVEIARNPEARIRDISEVAGITERTVQAIVADLEAAGYITRTRTGRRTVYTVNKDSVFRHSAQEGLRVGPFLDVLAGADDASGHPVTGSASADPDHHQAGVVGGVGDRAGEDPVGLRLGGQPPAPGAGSRRFRGLSGLQEA
jgi:MarR family